MSAPVRIQLSRAKGWRMPANTVKVDRSTGWGNPWIAGNPGRVKLHNGDVVQIGPDLTTEGAVDRFGRWMRGELGIQIGQYVPHRLFDAVLCPGAPPNAEFLRGQNLACWCRLCPEHKAGKPLGLRCEACAPCHSGPLGELANAPFPSGEKRS